MRLSSLPSVCQNLSTLVDIRSSDKTSAVFYGDTVAGDHRVVCA